VSLAGKVFSGAAWTIICSIGARVVSLAGTLVLTRFLPPEVAGEVEIAFGLCLTANMLANLGMPAFIVSRRDTGREGVFHATVFHVGLGLVAGAIILLVRHPLAPLFNAPAMVRYVPGLALALLLDRVSMIPERVLLRELRFRRVALTRGMSELLFSFLVVGLAAGGLGGDSIVWANLARFSFLLLVFSLSVDRREWLEPCRLSWIRTREMFRFGVPLAVANLSHTAARRWDNLLIGRLFGAGTVGLYKTAYNLADLPATHIGEPVGDVLLPSFGHLEGEARKRALVHAVSLLALVMFPLAAGLGATGSTFARALLAPAWWGVGPMLSILAAVSAARPVAYAINNYLQARGRTGILMGLEASNVGVLLLLIWLVAPLGPLAASAAAGLSFTVLALCGALVIDRIEGIRFGGFVVALARPTVACVPLVGAVLAVRRGLQAIGGIPPIVALIIEVAAGILAYIPAAFIFAPTASRELVRHVMGLVRRRREGDVAGEEMSATAEAGRP
jgi:lipopolysaccharide exporter